MFHKRLARLVLAGLIAAGVTNVIAGPASASPGPAGPIGIEAGCKFVLSEVKANRLQESAADEVFMQIGRDFTKSVKFREGETHLAPEFGTAAQTTEFIEVGGSILVVVWEDDWPSPNDQLGGFQVFCSPGHYTPTVNNFTSNYVIVFDVVVA
jgi:hypothetical protein